MTTTTSGPHDELKDCLIRGQLLYPEDPFCDHALHTWNRQAARRPEVVVSAHGPGDVIAALRYAKAKGLELTAKSGGHSMSSLCSGLVIDLSPMKSIRVDVQNMTARVEPGCLLRDLDAELSVHGLVVPGGVVSHTGVAGLALGGGWGYLGRSLGLTCDNILSVDIVTSDGQLRVASKTSNPDLFWAVRGAGPSFGVVTSFEFRCHPLPGPVHHATIVYPWARYQEVARAWMKVVTSGKDHFPNNLTLYFVGGPIPGGYKGTMVNAVFNGPAEQAKQLLKPFTDLSPLFAQIREEPFRLVQKAIDPWFPPGRHYYQTGTFVKECSEELFEVIYRNYSLAPSPHSLVLCEPQGGKISEVADDECAIGWRANKYFIAVFSAWEKEEEGEPNKAWARGLVQDLKKFRAETTYINLSVPDSENKGPARNFYGPHVHRLRELKQKWDPDNFFRFQTNFLY